MMMMELTSKEKVLKVWPDADSGVATGRIYKTRDNEDILGTSWDDAASRLPLAPPSTEPARVDCVPVSQIADYLRRHQPSPAQPPVPEGLRGDTQTFGEHGHQLEMRSQTDINGAGVHREYWQECIICLQIFGENDLITRCPKASKTFQQWFDTQACQGDEDYPSPEEIGFAQAAWNFAWHASRAALPEAKPWSVPAEPSHPMDSDESWEASEALCAVESALQTVSAHRATSDDLCECKHQKGDHWHRASGVENCGLCACQKFASQPVESQPSSADLEGAAVIEPCEWYGESGHIFDKRFKNGVCVCGKSNPAERTEGAQVELPALEATEEDNRNAETKCDLWIDGDEAAAKEFCINWQIRERQLQAVLSREAALKVQLGESDRKGRDLCAAYGNALIEIGDLKRDPMKSVMKLGIRPSPTGWWNIRAEKAEAELKAKDASHKVTLDREAATTARYDARLEELEKELVDWKGRAERQYDENVNRIHLQALAENEVASLREREQRAFSALSRLRNNAQHIFDKKAVRDWAETLAEADEAIAILTPKETV